MDDQAAQWVLYNILDDKNTATLKEYRQALIDHMGLYVSLSTLYNFWKEQGITWKKITKYAREADKFEVATFWDVYNTIVTDVEQLLFGDESHRNDNTVNRLYGRSSK